MPDHNNSSYENKLDQIVSTLMQEQTFQATAEAMILRQPMFELRWNIRRDRSATEFESTQPELLAIMVFLFGDLIESLIPSTESSFIIQLLLTLLALIIYDSGLAIRITLPKTGELEEKVRAHPDLIAQIASYLSNADLDLEEKLVAYTCLITLAVCNKPILLNPGAENPSFADGDALMQYINSSGKNPLTNNKASDALVKGVQRGSAVCQDTKNKILDILSASLKAQQEKKTSNQARLTPRA